MPSAGSTVGLREYNWMPFDVTDGPVSATSATVPPCDKLRSENAVPSLSTV